MYVNVRRYGGGSSQAKQMECVCLCMLSQLVQKLNE